MPKIYTIKEIKALARKAGGICVTKAKAISGRPKKLKWKCGKEHFFEMRLWRVKQGAWCPQCKEGQRLQRCLGKLNQLAKKRGGKCLSKRYTDNITKLKWKCRKGHVFEIASEHVKTGQWCGECRREKQREHQMVEVRKAAARKGGKCIAGEYIHNESMLTFRCKERHVWETVASSITRKDKSIWCPYCAGKASRTLEEMQETARQRGGKCLSEKYTDQRTKLRWQCKEGHVWETTPAIIMRGHWCARCMGVEKLSIGDMHEIAESRGGKCLSEEYVNNHTKLRWQCREGHVWEQNAMHIKSGGWCPKCAGVQKLTLEEMHELAARRGGKCLSTEYVNASTKLKWECRKGHVFEAEPGSIKNQGSWCPECFYKSKRGRAITTILNLDMMHELAAQHGGKCLSDKFVNSRTKLKWECKEGHLFEAEPRSIKYQGTWCAECYHEQRRNRDW